MFALDVLSPCECVTEFDAWMRNDHRQQPLTPPPAKIRAVGTFTNSKHHSPQLSQQNSTASASQRHYELILDVKDVNNCVVDLSPPSYLSLSPNASNRTDVNNADAAERPIDFGRSLLAGVCNSYSPHFILSGIVKCKCSQMFLVVAETEKQSNFLGGNLYYNEFPEG